MTEGNGRSGDHGDSVAIIGIACRFPGARDPAEFHDLAVAGRGMFQPAAALPGRPLRAAVLDDWNVPQIPADDFLTGALSPPALGPVRKLAAAGEEERRGGPSASVGTPASRLAADCVPRMRCAQEAGPSGPSPAGAMSGAGAVTPARSVT